MPQRMSVRPTERRGVKVPIRLTPNPVGQAFAGQLKARGKPFKVVITAVMRKLVATLNAILRSGEPWRAKLT